MLCSGEPGQRRGEVTGPTPLPPRDASLLPKSPSILSGREAHRAQPPQPLPTQAGLETCSDPRPSRCHRERPWRRDVTSDPRGQFHLARESSFTHAVSEPS